jgi:hypothetical protein
MSPTALPVRPRTFFALTYLLSWAIWVPLALSHFGVGPFHTAEGTSSIVRLLGVLMPATAALLLTAHAGGRQAVRGLMGRLAIWRSILSTRRFFRLQSTSALSGFSLRSNG